MDKLPSELLSEICSLMSMKDLKNFRLTSKTYAAVGGLHLIDTVQVQVFPADIHRLESITSHPVFCRTVKHLVFIPCSLKSYATRRKYERSIDTRGYARNRDRLPRHDLSPQQVDANYNAYVALWKDHTALSKNKMGVIMVSAALASLKNLQTLYVPAECYGSHDGMLAPQRVTVETSSMLQFAEQSSLLGGKIVRYEGVPEMESVEALLFGLATSRTTLHNLHLGIIASFFNPVINTPHAYPALANLETLTLTVGHGAEEPWTQEVEGYLSSGSMAAFLAAAPLLSRLSIAWEIRAPNVPYCGVMPNIVWPKLTELRLESFDQHGHQLIDLLTRHSKTLRSVSFWVMDLFSGKWMDVFRAMREQLTLTSVDLGDLAIMADDSNLDGSFYGNDYAGLEQWILHKGEFPKDEDELIVHII